MKSMQIRHLLLALALAAVSPFAAAVFQPGMNVEQAEAEAKAQQAAGASLAQIVANAQKAPLNAGLITNALINAGFNAADVVAAMLRAGAPLQVVVNAAFNAGATSAEIEKGALAANVSPADVQAAIAASPTEIAQSRAGSTPTGAAGAGGGGGNTGGQPPASGS
jgi:hypothetical protein